MINLEKTVIFHPGMGKTATSAIQRVGVEHCFDNLNYSKFGVLGEAHNYFSSIHPQYSEDKFTSEWQGFLNCLVNSDKNFLISSEFLIRDDPEHIKRMILDLKSIGYKVQVVFSIRSYTSYLISAFLQGVKVNWGVSPDETVFEFSKRELPLIRLPDLIKPWAENAGDENIFILDYDNNRHGFVEKFYSGLGAHLDLNEYRSENVNPSIKLAVAPLLRHFDRVSSNSSQRAEFISFINKLETRKSYDSGVHERIQDNIVKNSFLDDFEFLTRRYNWL
ncbi:conserved hypothetical protein [Vibrio chagasii]|nr:conserved hypothetical protein [Vibrio chagasii]CAH7017269.1 conserved hypothetical protein [Vibrio chagasii]CAH7053841.1 conserved hypothetical protein [Vibrio chagasii]